MENFEDLLRVQVFYRLRSCIKAAFEGPNYQKLLMGLFIKKLGREFVSKHATEHLKRSAEFLKRAFETLGRAFETIDRAFQGLREN